jgi:hypothetical protein
MRVVIQYTPGDGISPSNYTEVLACTFIPSERPKFVRVVLPDLYAEYISLDNVHRILVWDDPEPEPDPRLR